MGAGEHSVSKLVNADAVLVSTVGHVFILGSRGGKWCLLAPLFMETSRKDPYSSSKHSEISK